MKYRYNFAESKMQDVDRMIDNLNQKFLKEPKNEENYD